MVRNESELGDFEVFPEVADACLDIFENYGEVRSIYSDLRKIPSQCTGAACRCMILTQAARSSWLQHVVAIPVA